MKPWIAGILFVIATCLFLMPAPAMSAPTSEAVAMTALADDAAEVAKVAKELGPEAAQLSKKAQNLADQAVSLAKTLQAASSTGSVEIDILLKYLLLAFLFEAIYAAIFQWTIFIRYFDDTGARSIVKVVLAWITIANYPAMNVIHEMAVKMFGSTSQPNMTGQFMTALLIAGGSSAIYDIMKRYLRDKAGIETKITRINKNKDLVAREKELNERQAQIEQREEALAELEKKQSTQSGGTAS